jgi:hypothetical protein
LSDNAFN